MEKRDQFVFNSPISVAGFGADGRHLFVLTANQTAYWLDLFVGRPDHTEPDNEPLGARVGGQFELETKKYLRAGP